MCVHVHDLIHLPLHSKYSFPDESVFNSSSPSKRLPCSCLPRNPKNTPLLNHTVFDTDVGFAETLKTYIYHTHDFFVNSS